MSIYYLIELIDGDTVLRQKSEQVKEQTCLVSISVVSPVFEDEIITIIDKFNEIGIDSYTLLITPMYAMRGSANFEKHGIFAKYLKTLDQEISLHGFSHLTKTGQASEFKNLTSDQMRTRIQRGITSVQKAFGMRPFGFIPPQWAAPPRLLKIVGDAKLDYCAVDNAIHFLKKKQVLSTADHFVSHGDGKLEIVNSLLELEIGGAMQLAIHPSDCESEPVFDLISDMKERLGYEFVSYRDYLNSKV